MKPLLLLLLLFPAVVFSQAKFWKDELNRYEGLTKAQKASELADQAAAQNDFDSAIKLAEFGVDQAMSFGNFELAAKSCFQKGKFLVADHRKKPASSFRRSLELLDKAGSTNFSLMLDNLKQLRALAEADHDSSELIKIDQKIARINGILGDKQKAEQLAQQVSKLAESNQQLAKNNSSLTASQQKLSAAQAVLSVEIKKKNEAIVSLTEAQAKRELELANQRLLLDSLSFRRSLDSLALGQQQMAAKQAELELSEEKTARNLSLALAALGILAAFGIGYSLLKQRSNNRILEEKNKIIQTERARSEDLLLNILPVAVADELKKNGFAMAQSYEEVCVLFSDFKNFSQIAEKMEPTVLVHELDECFKEFDNIIGRHGIEKIKTIGDAYMCAAGFRDHDTAPRRIIQAALEIQDFLKDWNADHERRGLPRFDARLGVHTGPVVAGVVGRKKFAYDIWGDTVNIAARMEEAGEPGRVNVSGTTYELVKSDFKSVYRGKLPVKNRGEFDMYYVG